MKEIKNKSQPKKRNTEVRKDWKGRDFVLNKSFAFSELDEGVEVYREWEDLNIITPVEISKFKRDLGRAAQETVFHRLCLLQHNKKFLQSEGKTRRDKVERAIEKGLYDWKKKQSETITFITAVDEYFSIGKQDNPFDYKIQNTLVEQITYNSIVVISEKYFYSDWFQKLDKSKISSIRVYCPNGNNEIGTKQVKVHTSSKTLLPRKNANDTRPVVVLGGADLFEILYNDLTEIYITFVNKMDVGNSLDINTSYFTDLKLHNFELIECENIYENGYLTYQPTHLKRKKNHQLKWKKSSYDKRFM